MERHTTTFFYDSFDPLGRLFSNVAIAGRLAAQFQMVGSFANSEEESRFDGEIGVQVKAQLLDENDREVVPATMLRSC